MELERCGRPTYNKLQLYVRTTATRQPSLVSSTSSTVDEFCWQNDRHAVTKFSLYPEFGRKFQKEVPLFFEQTEFPYNTVCDGWKEGQLDLFSHFSKTPTRGRQTDTDSYGAITYTARYHSVLQ